MNSMLLAVETLHVSKRYGSTLALRDCTLNIPLGSITALVLVSRCFTRFE
jgi:hypothetical protein